MSEIKKPGFRLLKGHGSVLSICSLACLAAIFIGPVNGQDLRKHVNEGNALYHDEKFDEALTRYQDALLDDPRSEVAHFNQGDALYKLGKYDEAIEAYQKVIGSKERAMDQKAFYNIGNVYFQQNKLQESIESYKKALLISVSFLFLD